MAKTVPFLDFSAKFPTERACELYLEKKRWGDCVICPRCSHAKCYRLEIMRKVKGKKEPRLIYKCGKCRKEFSGRTGMFFEESRVPLRVWFFCIYEAINRPGGISSVEVSQRMGVTQKTAWFLLHRIREAMKSPEFNAPLSGKVVEIDETGVTTGAPRTIRKRKRGRGAEGKTPLVCAVERKGQVRCKVVANAKSSTLIPFVRENVKIGTTVYSDEWGSYRSLKKNGYEHDTVNHSMGEYAREDVHTNTVEGFFGNTKAKLQGTHSRVSAKHLQRYCDHFAWLYNTRELSDMERLDDWLSRSVGRLTYVSLVA